MDDATVGRVVRAVRLRRGWRQADVGRRAGVSQQEVSRLERGQAERVSLGSARRIALALEMSLGLAPRWRGPELDRLLDRDHASLVDGRVAVLHEAGWEVVAEWTFSSFGERGSVDLVGWHPGSRSLALIEVKTRIVDLQDLIATQDRKRRLAPTLLGDERSWQAAQVGMILVIADTHGNRLAVTRHAATFETRFPDRSWAIRRWIRTPDRDIAGIWFVPRPIESAPAGSPRRRRPFAR